MIGFMNKMGFSVVKNLCPADGFTKREYVNELLRDVNKDNPGVKDRIFTAVHKGLYKDFIV